MALKLDGKLRIGVITIHRRTEPATGPWRPSIDEMRELVELIDRSGYDSLWCGGSTAQLGIDTRNVGPSPPS